MAHSAEDPARGAEVALLKRVAEAHRAGRTEEAAALLAELGPDGARLHEYWEGVAAVAAQRNDLDEAVAAQARATELFRAQQGADSPGMLVTLARLGIAAGRVEVAQEARNRAAAAFAALSPDREEAEAFRQQLAAVDQGVAPLLWQLGQFDAAIAAQMRHVALVPDDVAALRRLRRALGLQDRLLEALLVQLRVALLEPDAPGPARDTGQMLRALGAEAAARAWFRRALVLQPEDSMAQALLEAGGAAQAVPPDPLVQRLARPMEGFGGAPADPVWPMALVRALDPAGAPPPAAAVPADWAVLLRDVRLAVLRRVLALRPDHAEAATRLAELLQDRHDGGSDTALRAALKLAPRDARMHMRLGFALHRKGQMHEAQRSFRTALSLDPDLPLAMVGLAGALQGVGPSEEALALLDQAQALDPSAAPLEALMARAVTLQSLQRMEEALAAYDAALEAAPRHVGAQFGRGLTLLAMGRLAEGWPGYAQRWHNGATVRGARQPRDPLQRPDPESWRGRTVLLYAEQALGDTIQFLRYARMVAAGGARVLLEVQRPLKRLAESIPDLAGVYGRGEVLPAFDEAVPLLHLPWALGTTLETIPATVPYLRGDLTRAAGFRRRLSGLPGLKVGLVWSGDPRPNVPEQALMDARRSVKLADLAPLAKVPGVVFVSLQKGAPAAQAASPPAGMVLHDWTEELADFTETAALMTALDLVISVDTAPAHLAGALGRPVWLLNRFDTDFRWLLGRDDSPWYPTMRQFRQARPGAWAEVILRVADALRERAGRGG